PEMLQAVQCGISRKASRPAIQHSQPIFSPLPGGTKDGLPNVAPLQRSKDVLSIIASVVVCRQSDDPVVATHDWCAPPPLPVWRSDLQWANEPIRAGDKQVLAAVDARKTSQADRSAV